MPHPAPNSPPRCFDVVVVGGGLVGATSACLFARQGLKVGLVEARSLGTPPNADADAGRVSAINLAAVNVFKALDVWPALPPATVTPYHGMRVWDCNSAAKISFRAADIGAPCLGYIVENRALQDAMVEKLRHNYQVTLFDGAAVTAVDPAPINREARLAISLSDARDGANGGNGGRTRRIETQLLVAADGGDSRVRDLCGIATQFTDFEQDAIIATTHLGGAHRDIAHQCFLDTGPVAMLPLAGGRCAVVWSCDRALADELMALDDAAFCARLQALFFHELGAITAAATATGRRRFPLRQHHVSRYIAAATALVGDAAHLTHPLAGLGANLGLMDAAALAEVVAQAAAAGRDLGQPSVLRRYERWRRGDNALALAAMTGFKEVFGSRRRSAQMARAAGMNLVASIAPLKNLAMQLATGLRGDLPAIGHATAHESDADSADSTADSPDSAADSVNFADFADFATNSAANSASTSPPTSTSPPAASMP